MKVKDKVVVISGAGGGLGRVITQVFAREGAKLVLLGRDAKKLDAMAADFGIEDERVLAIGLDIGNAAATIKAAKDIVERFGRIDIFMNLVGGWIGGEDVLDTEIDQIDAMLQQHIRSSYYMIKAFLPPMLENSWGRLLAVSSPSADRPPGNNAPYAIGKAGMEALMLSLAEELKESGVTSNLVRVNTIDVKHERIKNPSKKNQSWSTPEEISATLLHLCTEEAGMINGARIPLYGSP